MPDLPVLGIVAAPIVLAAISAEWWAVRRGRIAGRYCARDTATSLTMCAGNVLINSAMAFLSFWVLSLAASLRPVHFDLTPVTIAAGLIAHDALYYCKHRIGHRARWFWAEHVTHHSSQHYNLTTALRQPWTGPMTGLILIGGPMVLIGFPVAIVLGTAAVHLAYQFWIHTEAINRLPGWAEAVFVTPSHHRVHHATNPRYLDANYGGIFIIWDRLFGTFVREDAEDVTRYGIVTPLESHNPLVVAYHGFGGLILDCRGDGLRPDRWARRALNPPGWSPDGNHMRSEELRAGWRARQAADEAAGSGEVSVPDAMAVAAE